MYSVLLCAFGDIGKANGVMVNFFLHSRHDTKIAQLGRLLYVRFLPRASRALTPRWCIVLLDS